MPAQAVQLFPIKNSDNAWRDEVFDLNLPDRDFAKNNLLI